jgi:hypothetical protein
MQSEPPPPRQPWSGDEEPEAPDYLGAAPPLQEATTNPDQPSPDPTEAHRLEANPFSADTILAEPSLFAPPGTSRRGPYIGWTIVALLVVLVVLILTGVLGR